MLHFGFQSPNEIVQETIQVDTGIEVKFLVEAHVVTSSKIVQEETSLELFLLFPNIPIDILSSSCNEA